MFPRLPKKPPIPPKIRLSAMRRNIIVVLMDNDLSLYLSSSDGSEDGEEDTTAKKMVAFILKHPGARMVPRN